MTGDSPQTIDLNYLKTPDFREIACDGVVGGPTPQGKIWVAFYTERFPLPRIVRHGLIETGPGEFKLDTSVAPEQLDGRVGLIRNVEVGVYLSAATAKDLRDWLNKQIETLTGASDATQETRSEIDPV